MGSDSLTKDVDVIKTTYCGWPAKPPSRNLGSLENNARLRPDGLQAEVGGGGGRPCASTICAQNCRFLMLFPIFCTGFCTSFQ